MADSKYSEKFRSITYEERPMWKGHRDARTNFTGAEQFLFEKVEEFLKDKGKYSADEVKNSQEKRGFILGAANKEMDYGLRHADVRLALNGAKAYEKLGEADRPRVVQRLLGAYEKAMDEASQGLIAKELVTKYAPDIETFLEKHGEKAERKGKKDLTTKAGITTTFVGILSGLFVLSSNMTGNSISNLNQTSSNWIGASLFLIGLIGAFVYLGRK